MIRSTREECPHYEGLSLTRDTGWAGYKACIAFWHIFGKNGSIIPNCISGLLTQTWTKESTHVVMTMEIKYVFSIITIIIIMIIDCSHSVYSRLSISSSAPRRKTSCPDAHMSILACLLSAASVAVQVKIFPWELEACVILSFPLVREETQVCLNPEYPQ